MMMFFGSENVMCHLLRKKSNKDAARNVLISSELRGFAPSRETVFCAKLQRVQEK
jgi:hypothetical protein